jgi:DNA repair protein RadC
MVKISLVKEKSEYPKVKVTSSRQAYAVIAPLFEDCLELYESFYLITLNQANITTGYTQISFGGIAATLVDVRIVAKYAIESLSTAVILAHNHPSGILMPSEADISLTSKIKDALKLLDITVVDHLIIGSDAYYSFAEEGQL